MAKTTPTYTHDCKDCRFVASVRLNQRYDVYRCPQGAGPLGDTLIARYGNDGPEYWSMDSGVLARSILAERDRLDISPPMRAILIACTYGHFDQGGRS
jgi:hypothetical protein